MTVGNEINLALTLVTVLMAAGTLYLAVVTQKLARDTARGIEQADRHHQDNLRPFCVIDFDASDEQNPFGFDFDPANRQQSYVVATKRSPPRGGIWIRGSLRNKGGGPATDVVVYLNARVAEGEAGALRITRPVVVSGLVGTDDTLRIGVMITERDVMHVWTGEKWKPVQVFHAIAGQAYEVVFEYKDVFGKSFRTVYPRGIWTPPIPDVASKASRERMMTRPDRPTPLFLTGRQAVKTLADLPPTPMDLRSGDPP